MRFVLPVASLLTAMVAVSFRHRPEAPASFDSDAEWGVLVLGGAQLAGLAVEGNDLVLDVFGGAGSWTGHRADGVVEDAPVSGTPMLTLRAGFASRDELALGLQRLERWWRAGSRLTLEMLVSGKSLDQPPRRVVLGDGARSVSLLAPALGYA